MMKLENQVVSLELSKKLKELGVKQESLWYWVLFVGNKNQEWSVVDKDFDVSEINRIPAPTVAELGELLPCATKIGDIRFYNIGKQKHITMGDINIVEFTEANARSKLLIYLIENKLVKI